MQKPKESFLAFFSYAHSNDKHGRGKLTQLRRLLQNEIWDQTGKSFEIFQDYENIGWGQDWMQRIKDALDSSPLLIAIITPSYLASQSCKYEFEYFLKREDQLQRKLILPILYIDTPELANKNNTIAVEISKRQWEDWRDLRFASLTSIKVSKKLEMLAKQIRKLIDEKIFESIETTSENEYQLPGSVIRKASIVELSPKTSPHRAKPSSAVQAVEAPNGSVGKLPPLYAPTRQVEDRTHPPQQITFFLRPTGDRERDKRRIKILYSTLISFYGHDRFTFQFLEGERRHLIDFPNDTTQVCSELLTKLKKIIGEESWRIDEITFQ